MRPAASVIVPSYARPAALAECLRALANQSVPNLEIIVVDDGSPEPLAPVCDAFEAVRCIRQENAGPAAARNHGARMASGSFLAFTDDDCRPRPDWMAGLIAAHGGALERLVGGRVENGLAENPFAMASQDLCDFLYDWFGAAEGTMPFFTSNNIGCSRERFLSLGGFDQTFPLAAAEDREFGLRWREQGGELIYSEAAVIDHFHPLTLRRYWRQHHNYGRGAYHLHKVLDTRGSNTPRREPLSFYIALVLGPIRRRGIRGFCGSGLAVLSQMAMIAGYSAAARR